MHVEALTKNTAALLPRFAKFKKFYLVGGTALALQIGHRISVDFDFFSTEELPANLLQRVKKAFSDSSVRVTYRTLEQLNLLIDEVQATFFQYPYPFLDSFTDYKGIKIASIREISAMKAFSIGRRLSYKDYVDWYFILKEKHVDLPDIIGFCEKKFGNDFNDRLFLGQLVSLEDIPEQKINFLRNAVEREEIQEFLTKTVANFQI